MTELSPHELAGLSAWMAVHQADVWDEQIERDLDAGRLDALLDEVGAAYDCITERRVARGRKASCGFGSERTPSTTG